MSNLVLNIFVDRNTSMVERRVLEVVFVFVVINRNETIVDDRYPMVASVVHREEELLNVHIVERKVVELFVDGNGNWSKL